MLYPLLAPAMFLLDPETAHRLTIAALRLTQNPGLALGRILIGQLGKVLLTVGMFLASSGSRS